MKEAADNQKGVIALLKALSGQERVLTIPRTFIDLMQGDLEGALFLSQCLFWSDRGDDPEWFYKTADEWEAELTLSYYKVTKYTEQLEAAGILKTMLRKKEGAPRLHYHVEMQAVAAWIESFVMQQQLARADSAQPAEEVSTRKKRNAVKKAERLQEAEALLPSTEGGFILFNLLTDEYRARDRRAPIRFKSLIMKQRFERAEERLGANIESAILDALAIPIIELNRIVAYLAKWGANGNGSKRFDNQSQATENPVLYTDKLTAKQQSARARIEAAKDKQAAAAAVN